MSPPTRLADIHTCLARHAGTLAGFALALALLPASLSAQWGGVFAASTIAAGDGHLYLAVDGGPLGPGAVHVFARAGDGWGEVGQLAPEGGEPGMGFGAWVALDSDRMVVGASASAHFFERTDGAWAEVADFDFDAPTRSAVIAGDVVALTSGRPASEAPGMVHVYRRGPDGWGSAGVIEAPDDIGAGRFGAALAVVGDAVAVGAPFAGTPVGLEGRDDPSMGPGAVYLYLEGEDGWTQAGEALVPGIFGPSGFGSALRSTSGPDGVRLYVSSIGGPGVGPAVFEYAQDAETGEWRELMGYGSPMYSLRARPRSPSVAFVGGELWIGGLSSGAEAEGQVLRYAADGRGELSLAGVLALEEPVARARFGGQVAASGGLAAVEAPGSHNGAGAVHIFEEVGGEWVERGEVWADPPNYAAIEEPIPCEDGRARDFDCEQVDLLSFVPLADIGADRGIEINDIWGWTDSESGREYALVGLENATSFVDVTDPSAPRYLGRMMMPETANRSVWRDIKVYSDHAFVVSDGAGAHGMQVFDLTRLREVAESGDFEADAHYDGIASAHNMVVNEATGFAYSVGSSSGGETCGGGLHMIDVRDPKNPNFAGCFAHEGTGRRGTGYTHDALCVKYAGPDADYAGREICFGANETAVSIADVTDKSSPIAVSLGEYSDPGPSYTHQGWLTEDHRFLYVGDELDEGSMARAGSPLPGTRTVIFDVSDLDDPLQVGAYYGETGSTDHNMYVVGDLLYQSNYTSGLRILDISDPTAPHEVGYIDTVPYDESVSMSGSWSNYPFFASGTVLVTSGREGLFMVRYRMSAE